MEKRKGCKVHKKIGRGLVYAHKKRIIEAAKERRRRNLRSLRKMFACAWKKMSGVP